MTRAASASLLVLLAGALLPARATKVDCEPARCAVQAVIAAQCPCADATNHGRYVSCVAHLMKQAAADGTIPVNCKGKITRCAARSTCGKDGFVTCEIPTDTCVIPEGALSGTCSKDPSIACLSDLDCGARCKIKSSADRCTAAHGFVGTATSCCPGCVQAE